MTDFVLDVNALLSSNLVAAFLGSAFTLVGVWWTHRLQRAASEKAEEEHIHGVMQGIHDEIETLWDVYLSTAGVRVEALDDGKPLNIYWPITQDYFTIYNTNSFFIGKIKDHDLRKQIVTTYSKCRGLVDSFRMNNELVQKLENATLLFQETQNPLHQNHMLAREQALIHYASSLKKSHFELKNMVSSLLRQLRKTGVLSSVKNQKT